MHTSSKLITLLTLALFGIALTGCRAMDTHDIDGSHYQNERRSFYAPEKEADVKAVSHAYRWVSGNLQGNCRQADGAKLQESLPSLLGATNDQHYPVDTIYIESAGLFLTNSTTLTTEGEKLLAQVIHRLEAYPELLHLTVDGHTDDRGSFSSNDILAKNRAGKIAGALHAIAAASNIRVKASGEYRPIKNNKNANQRAKNRRVSITAVVATLDNAHPSTATSINTLCQGTKHQPTNANLPVSSSKLQERINQSLQPAYSERPPLSAGDRIRIAIPEGEDLSGVYEVGLSGQLEIPFIGLISAQGINTRVLEKTIHDRLIEEQIFRPGMLRVSTTVQEWAPVDVLVSGATFDPGRVTINRQKAEYRTFKQSQLSGDFAKDRLLSAALYSAGGIRPDADLQHVQLIRNGEVKTINLYGLFDGTLTKDIALAAGDQIVVPSAGYFQSKLVRRTQITPPGIRIFISNLSIPALNNSQSAVNSSSTSMPYGTRFLQGLLSGNCIGGTQLTNASRRAVLISTNPLTGRTEVIERSIQQLVSDPERDEINPFLMPNDGIDCYDSGVTNFRDVTRTFGEFLSPLLDLKSLY